MFKQIKGFENYYEIDENGIVKSVDRMIWNGKGYVLKKGQILKQAKNIKGYKICYLSKNGKQKTCFVHRLVAITFIPNPQNLPQINHIDCNKENNNITNLEWCSNLDNHRHAIKNGLVWRWENAGRKKIKVVKIDPKNNAVLEEYNSIAEASRLNHINSANLNSVIKGKRNLCGGYKWKKII